MNVSSAAAVTRALRPMRDWFRNRGWKPFPFQEQVWRDYLAGQSGLVHATTGTGKTYAAWGGPLLRWLSEQKKPAKTRATEDMVAKGRRKKTVPRVPKLRVLWITPLRALAADTENALQTVLTDLDIPWRLERRTGDTTAAVRARQRETLPTALITTPESLSLLLARDDAAGQFDELETIIIDEWHELLGTKRGTQTELCLARLRTWRPALQLWALSATLGNLDEALHVLLGPNSTVVREKAITAHDVQEARTSGVNVGHLVQGATKKSYVIDSMIPKTVERFPWAGHLGIRLLEPVIEQIEKARSTLVFTNTRSGCEIWYQSILKSRPDWAGRMALHHGSLDQNVRKWVEEGLRAGELKCVVCTSSLDLGVDFSPVDQVLQIGSPKGVARLLQRAGRSGHQPGGVSRIQCVPTHALELIEFAAARAALQAGHIESRAPRRQPLDVLVQHAVTVALGSGFTGDDLLAEVRRTVAYQGLSTEDWHWVLDFIHRGGEALRAYPDYQRVDVIDGRYQVTNRKIAQQHRMAIGTITSDSALSVQYLRGNRLGTIEESFIARMKPGDTFIFSGKLLELIRVHDMTAYVRPGKAKSAPVPRWGGGRMPLSTELSLAVREKLDTARQGIFDGPEMECVQPILELQDAWSRVPALNEVLIERLTSKEGFHLFIYPFEGRLVHEGLASLFAYRLSRQIPISFTMAINDYGFELLGNEKVDLYRALDEGLLSTDHLAEDIAESLNAIEMAKRQFREVARISGLIFQGFPGAAKSNRQIQASAGLLYEVFSEYDPGNLLLRQARHEVLEQQLEVSRLRETLCRLQHAQLVIADLPRYTPLSFPLMVDRLREKLTSEQLADRVRKMTVPLEKAAGGKRK